MTINEVRSSAILGQVLPELRAAVEEDFKRLTRSLLERGIDEWAAHDFRRHSQNENDCTMQLHKHCDGLTREHPEFGLLHIELESITPDDATLAALTPASRSPRPDMRVTIVGTRVGVSVECKRLRRSASDFRNYSSRGIHRYKSARYGADDSFGLMIGYLQGCAANIAVEGINAAISRSGDFDDTDLLSFGTVATPTTSSQSHHTRAGREPIELDHYLVNVGELGADLVRASPAPNPDEARDPPRLWPLTYNWVEGTKAAEDEMLVDACMALYNSSYGIWGEHGPRPGQNVRVSRNQFLDLISSPCAGLAYCHDRDRLVGYCIAVQFDTDEGVVSWVTQLVVEPAYRRIGVASKLLFSVWNFSGHYCWGLATSNPFAVRALEMATLRLVSAKQIRQNGPAVLRALAEHVPYLAGALTRSSTARRFGPAIDTEFYVDHTESELARKSGKVSRRKWQLGDLGEGEEWFACVFADQGTRTLSKDRVRDLLVGSDEIWQSAYARMTLDESHAWRLHAPGEVKFCLSQTEPWTDLQVADIGCGDGRHAKVFSSLGHAVVGIEISEGLLTMAKVSPSSVEWLCHDARIPLPISERDLVIALYDVLGSSADKADDERILRNVTGILRPGGILVLSVMNSTPSLAGLSDSHLPTTDREFIQALQKLPASSTMEQTGAVFDPDLMIFYDGVFYRKELFEGGPGHLPSEYVVRDRRFSVREIESMIAAAGLEQVAVFPARLGHWSDGPVSEGVGKEIVAVARRSDSAPSGLAEVDGLTTGARH